MPTERAPHNMTTNSAPSPYVAAASSFYPSLDPYHAFSNLVDLATFPYWVTNGTDTGWISIDFGSGNTFVITDYNVEVNLVGEPNRAPKNWTLEGSNDNSSWTTIDTRTNQTSWATGENRAFTCSSPGTTAWRYIRLNVSANNGDAYLQCAELYLQGEPAVGGGVFVPIIGRGPGMALAGRGGLVAADVLTMRRELRARSMHVSR